MGYHGELIGNHPSVIEMRRLIGRVARSPARCVLIYGETGTGKGLVARMVHEQSARAGKAFVDVNCAAIPANLMESELFGHERGAFTGALSRKEGLIEAAHGGSVFLDEIRELDPVLQAKLLSLLDTQRFRRVGATRSIEVDVRFVAATNRILLGEVNAGQFRDDLYYRLQVVAINIPPLRERGSDVLVLAEYFMRRYSARYGRTIQGLEPAVQEVFQHYRWPGNVRELENLLERVFVLEDDNTVLMRHLPARILRELERPHEQAEASTGGLSFADATARFQRGVIQAAMEAVGGNRQAAAERLGMSRHALRHQMIKLGIEPGA